MLTFTSVNGTHQLGKDTHVGTLQPDTILQQRDELVEVTTTLVVL